MIIFITIGSVTCSQIIRGFCRDRFSQLENEVDDTIGNSDFFMDTSEFDSQENFSGEYCSDIRQETTDKNIDSSIAEDYYNFNINGVEKYTYGRSGKERPLYYYKIGNGNKILFLNFGIHGYEDAWSKDGVELTKLSKNLIQRLSNDNAQNGLNDWLVVVVSSSNPDGVLDGWSNNGPGRTQISQSIDLNRSFPTYFTQKYSPRYYSGLSPLEATEAKALANLVDQYSESSAHMALVDVHGWLNKTIGDPSLSKNFDTNFDMENELISKWANGFLISYAHSKGALVTLLELPMPSSLSSIEKDEYANKIYDSVKSIIINGDGFEITNSNAKVNTDLLNVRITTSTNSDVIGSYNKEDNIKVLGKVGDWYQVNLGNDYGYIYKDYIDILSTDEDNKNIEMQKNNRKFNIKNYYRKFFNKLFIRIF